VVVREILAEKQIPKDYLLVDVHRINFCRRKKKGKKKKKIFKNVKM